MRFIVSRNSAQFYDLFNFFLSDNGIYEGPQWCCNCTMPLPVFFSHLEAICAYHIWIVRNLHCYKLDTVIGIDMTVNQSIEKSIRTCVQCCSADCCRLWICTTLSSPAFSLFHFLVLLALFYHLCLFWYSGIIWSHQRQSPEKQSPCFPRQVHLQCHGYILI